MRISTAAVAAAAWAAGYTVVTGAVGYGALSAGNLVGVLAGAVLIAGEAWRYRPLRPPRRSGGTRLW